MGGIISLDDKGLLEIDGLAGDCNDCVYLYVYENVTASISWKENIEELKLNKSNLRVESKGIFTSKILL